MTGTLPADLTDPTAIAMRLIIDGVAVIPGAVVGDELQNIRDAFELQADKLGSRAFEWDGFCQSPGLMQYICHPALMAVMDAFMAHFDQQCAFTCCSGARDVYEPSNETQQANARQPDIRNVGWHDDVMGMKNPLYTFTAESVSSLLYMDDTFENNGAYCTALGSHHLARRGPNDEALIANAQLVFDHCKLCQVPVTAGSIILHRAHNWHGVMSPRQNRRLIITTFAVKAFYELQRGHTQLTPDQIAQLPADRHKYITHYA